LSKKDPEDIRRATVDARRTCSIPGQNIVRGPTAVQPEAISGPTQPGSVLNVAQFLEIAERLTREDVVHSLLAVKAFPATSKKDEKRKIVGGEKCYGFPGPRPGTRGLTIKYPSGTADVVLIDDTGNRFRKGCPKGHSKRDPGNPWPDEVAKATEKSPLIIYKL